MMQKTFIEAQKQEIEDSIRYAFNIQNAVLPSKSTIKSALGEHFILFKPKDVVSGDFFWVTKSNDWIIVTVADCTGHGVPGAFMSMLGVSFLNEIVRKKEVTNAAQVLNKLRAYVIHALKQKGEDGEQKDGMDMSLLAINSNTKQCHWAGANNPLWIIRNNTKLRDYEDAANAIEEIKGDKMPVAVHIRMRDFTNHEVQINPGDRLYLFSDGFPDQFGGQNGKKIKSKPFKRMVAETSTHSMKAQGKKLENYLMHWMNGYGQKFDQIDDITVLGLEI